KHRRSGNGNRERRLVAQDYGRRARRNPAAQRNAEHDGGPAEPVRRRSNTRGPRSGYRRKVGRTGQRAWSRWYVEGFDGLGQLDGRKPYRPGAKHRGSNDGGGSWRFVAENHRRREGRNSRTQKYHI